MRALILSLALLTPLASAGTNERTPEEGDGACASSCSLDDAPAHGLSESQFRDLITAWLDEPMAAPSMPLETLLFYGIDSQAHLATLDLSALRSIGCRVKGCASHCECDPASHALSGPRDDGHLVFESSAHFALSLSLPTSRSSI